MTDQSIAISQANSTRVSGRAIIVLIIAGLVYVIAALERISPPVVALDIRVALGLGPDDLGMMFSATFIAYALTQPIAGFGADRFGPKRCLTISAIMIGVASIMFAYSQSFWPAALARGLVGFSAGFAFVPAVRLAANWLPPRYLAMASTCILAASALSNFLAGSPLARTANIFGWRWAFLVLGLAAIALGVLVLLVVSDRPGKQVYENQEAADQAQSQEVNFFTAAKMVLSHPMFWLMSMVYAGTDMLYDTYTGLWAGPYLMEAHALSSVDAGNMLSVASIGFLIGGPLLVLFGDRWGSYTKVLICLALGNAAITAFIIWGPADAAPWMLYLLCLVAPLGVHGTGLLFAIGRGFFPENVTGTVIGFLNLMPFMAGALMQNIIGRVLASVQTDPVTANLSAHYHYGQAFKPVLFWCILTVLAALWLHRTRRGQRI